ncbi:zinc finger protein CONSTANS-LIKE 13 isoform X2 [Vigna radiata var. radiata]|uniref:Zinc finger protein CONSTANS-LIKE 13 isoform X2 n=1 Tax=Vigna radiata var. radiata TaxID=3916 RepID=A0A3Q0FEQ1_VIGRR|nr:zinc finger protein CONSTANS-LIKE 13 isoform X2 [Vigna radiata var. radiata]
MNASPNQKQRTCDYCGDFTALLYCRADSAKLCFFCDRKLHFPNQLFSKHSRTQLCDECGDSPASVLCYAENSVFCHHCDCENHNNHLLSQQHQRRPLQGFSGCPSVIHMLMIFGLTEKSLLSTEVGSSHHHGLSNLHVWNAPSVFGLEDFIASSSSYKNRKGACGRQKEEILSQLGELIKLEPDLIHGEVDAAEPQKQFGNLSTGFERDIETNMFPSYEAGVFRWHGESSDRANQIVPSDNSVSDYSELVSAKDPSFTIPVATTHERDSALLRYREKKKTRSHEHTPPRPWCSFSLASRSLVLSPFLG